MPDVHFSFWGFVAFAFPLGVFAYVGACGLWEEFRESQRPPLC